VAFFILCTAVSLGLYYSLVRCYLHKQRLIKAISNADRVDVYKWNEPDMRIWYVGENLQEILKAIRKSHQDDGVYDTPIGVYQMEFYQKSNKLATILYCSNLFRFQSKQYRAADNVLMKFIDTALDESQSSSRGK